MGGLAEESYISLICNGEFDAVPGFPIGELFESFFDNINYNVLKENRDTFVDFTGDAMCDDKPCTILIRFIVNEELEEFEIVLVKVNDDVLNEPETLDLLEDIAFAGGAIIEDSCATCSGEECSHCHHEDNHFEEQDDDEEDENEI